MQVKNITDLLIEWDYNLKLTQNGHYEALKPLSKSNLYLGLPVVILTSFVGTSVFANLENTINSNLRVLIGSISVLSAVLASLQTFLKLSERAEKHRQVAARAGSLRRNIKQILIMENLNELPTERIDQLRNQIDNLAENAPPIPDKVWDRLRKRDEKYAKQNHHKNKETT